jgi:hypothetical protein
MLSRDSQFKKKAEEEKEKVTTGNGLIGLQGPRYQHNEEPLGVR